MTERLLQYIWQFQYFSHQELKTTSGDMLTVLHPGTYNSHQGPDFLEAKIRIAGIILVGNIELHVRASDWSRHFHADDPNYQRLLLHVVWRNDAQVVIAGTPTLTLEHRISGLLLSQYDSWMHSGSFIPCEKLIGQVDSLVWHQWQERLTLER